MSLFLCMCIAVVFGGCATVPSPQTTTAPSPHTASAVTHRVRPGSIESIEKVEEEKDVSKDPIDDALMILLTGGLLFGNLLFHHGTGRVVGTGKGAWSTASDGDSSKLPRYRVIVRFDDGDSMALEYLGYVPFDRDERVVLTDHGLYAPVSTR